tara:strand:- start:146 stop:1195 length:1050 start_codon:yes stop_codon:yes gene_type:complete
MTRTNEKISKSILKKSYATNLKNDADRKNPRHGLACEYLFEVLREKQFYKEMLWLCINLRKEYKKEIIPLVKQKIKDIKDLDKEIKKLNEDILEKQDLFSEYQKIIDDPNNKYNIALNKSEIKNLKKEIQKNLDIISNYKNELKLIFKCRSKIFELINTVELGLKTKNSIFLIDLQKNIYNKIIIPSKCIEKPINSISMGRRGSNRTNTIVAFADVFIPYSGLDLVEISVYNPYKYQRDSKKFNIILKTNIGRFLPNANPEHYKYFSWDKWSNSTLGEVKIAKQQSEEVLQQINFYHELVFPTKTYICLDYQDSQLLNLTKDSKIQVNCLGSKFEEFCKNRPEQKLEEI